MSTHERRLLIAIAQALEALLQEKMKQPMHDTSMQQASALGYLAATRQEVEKNPA